MLLFGKQRQERQFIRVKMDILSLIPTIFIMFSMLVLYLIIGIKFLKKHKEEKNGNN